MRAGAAADPLVQDVLAHLRGLAAARVAAHQRHGVLVDGLQDLSAEGEYRQLLALLGGGLQLGVSLLALGPVCFEVPKEALTLNTFVDEGSVMDYNVKRKIGL